jgi:hypothetical protein
MDGWLRVDAEVLETADGLRRWVSQGVTPARSLAPVWVPVDASPGDGAS